MSLAPAYRDPLESAAARIQQLERDKAELLALTAGARRARTRRRVGIVLAVVAMLVTGPALAWIVRGSMPPPPPEPRTFAGKYTIYNWSTTTTATVSGPMTLTVDPKTGVARGWATGPIGSVRVTGQVRDRDVEVLALSPDADARGVGTGRVVGDAIIGSFGVPKTAASAGFTVAESR